MKRTDVLHSLATFPLLAALFPKVGESKEPEVTHGAWIVAHRGSTFENLDDPRKCTIVAICSDQKTAERLALYPQCPTHKERIEYENGSVESRMIIHGGFVVIGPIAAKLWHNKAGVGASITFD